MPRKSAATTQAELENLIADLRDVLARKEMDVVPEIYAALAIYYAPSFALAISPTVPRTARR